MFTLRAVGAQRPQPYSIMSARSVKKKIIGTFPV
jgi:hypothetical protein